MWRWHEGMGWWMVFGGVWMVLLWAGIIALIVWPDFDRFWPSAGGPIASVRALRPVVRRFVSDLCCHVDGGYA
jgi:hypothetical protein